MNVIAFNRKEKSGYSDLNTLLQMAVDLREKMETNSNISNFEAHISGKIMDILLKQQMIEQDTILCGIYVSDLLGSLFKFLPDHWVATDYMLESQTHDNPLALQKGANMCFLICSIFPNKLGRCMKLKHYRTFGISMFKQFYDHTGKEIAFYMSERFPEMTDVAKECVKNI